MIHCSSPHLHLFLSAMVSRELYPPLSPAPSASISSSSGVAPPVIRDRIRVRAFWLKYVCKQKSEKESHAIMSGAHCGHQGIEDADSKGCATSEGLSEVQLSVGVIVIILVQELDIAVIDKFSDHRDIGAIHRALPLQHDGAAERRFARTLLKYRKKCKIIAIRK